MNDGRTARYRRSKSHATSVAPPTLASPGDGYVGPTGRGENGRYPVLVDRRSDAATDGEAARRLWEDPERVTGVRYDFGAHSCEQTIDRTGDRREDRRLNSPSVVGLRLAAGTGDASVEGQSREGIVMTQDRPQAEQSSRDRIVQEVADKVQQRPSVDTPRDEIEARAGKSVDSLVDRPVQSFTPLLAENEVLDDLLEGKQQGEDEGHQDRS